MDSDLRPLAEIDLGQVPLIAGLVKWSIKAVDQFELSRSSRDRT